MNQRLDHLLTELGKHFGKLTRWKALCVERGARTDEDKIRLAEGVLAAYSTGTVAEWYSYHLRLPGKKSMNHKEYLAGREAEDRPRIADPQVSVQEIPHVLDGT